MQEDSFHSRLRAAIAAHGAPITAVAAHLNVSRHTVSRWCKYQMPESDQICNLSAYLGVTADYLKNGTPIDEEHMAKCRLLFSLSTGLKASDVDTFIYLCKRLLAPDVEQTE